MTRAEHKVPGGKMIRVEAEAERDEIRRVVITGDFFSASEDFVEKLEAALRGRRIVEPELRELVEGFFEREGVEVVGASPQDFATALLKALAAASSSKD